ncbi:hypothetical protein RTG_01944 [Rhodotorula toruloides ATCC 204091]|uniref:BTB domain-containing protein n=1 Tax=Rhodotorula toruloides TaxID=5286 RepID=A0A0K3CFX3_RHOTO|nr:hypothetical protein RTG_01944 [Rhodotorula toruloides ATCC 204091]PRQ76198.1 hypothetical protein AAT19DRAFT_13220 [Rhodotorula toruloides]
MAAVAPTLLRTVPLPLAQGKATVESVYQFSFAFDVELDLSNPKLNVAFTLPNEDVPLRGEWKCTVRWREDEELAFALQYGDLPLGSLGWATQWRGGVRWCDTGSGGDVIDLGGYALRREPCPDYDGCGGVFTGFHLTISKKQLEQLSELSKGSYRFEGYSRYRILFELRQVRSRATPGPSTLIKRSPDAELIALPHDVRFVFPATGGQLWAQIDFLVRSSSYFKTLLASDFAEAISVPSKRARTANSKSAAATVADADLEDAQDSDDETDELYFKQHSVAQQKPDEMSSPYKEIKITKTAFTTYRAVLAYLRTGHIAFAPMSSTFSQDADADAPTRRTRLEAAISSDPSLPYPISPQSAYRLAHLLELDDLQRICLAEFEKQLTVECTPHELFDDASVCYDAWRQVVVSFAAEKWQDIVETPEWAEVEDKIARHELPTAAPIMVELMKAREKARAAPTFDSPEDQYLFRSILQRSDLWVEVTGLSSAGTGGQGEMTIHRGPSLISPHPSASPASNASFGSWTVDAPRIGSMAVQYKLEEAGAVYQVKGGGTL